MQVDYQTDPVEYDEKGKPKIKRPKVEAKRKRNDVYSTCIEKEKGYKSTINLLENDDDFKQMRAIYTQDFFETWRKGFDLYIQGKWADAMQYFQKTQVVLY